MLLDEVLVAFACPEALDPPGRREAALALLTESERQAVARFRFDHDRQLHLAARALLRRTLSRCANVAPEAWRFRVEAGGRPEVLAPATGLRFNVSHTRGLAMVAVASGADIGADIERIPGAVPLDVLERCFAAREQALVLSAPLHEQAARFAEMWTLKEAYAKARGLGLALALDAFAFELDPPRLVMGDEPTAWSIERYSPTPAHRAALCVRGALPYRVSVRWDEL